MNPLYPTVRRLLYTIVFALSFYSLFSQPVITSFSPAAGPVASWVVIKGRNFNPSPGSNIVRFGVVQAGILGGNADSLAVQVPAGANYQELTVTSAGLTGYYNTKSPFVETFGTGGTAFSAGSFAAGIPFSVDGDALSVMDLNGDGRPDVVSGTLNVNGVDEGKRAFSVLNNGSSSGTVAFSAQHFSVSNAPYYCATADMNGDGRPDIVAWDTTTVDQMAVYLNNGSGTTISFDGGTRYAYGGAISGQPGKIIVRDLDGDGKPDVLTSHTVPTGDTTYFSFLQNTGSGGAVSLAQLPDLLAQVFNTGTRKVYDFIVQDFDGDGKPDILSVQQNGFYFYQNTSTPGNISFSAGTQVNYIPPGTIYSGLAAADMDGDGFPELIYVQPSTNQLFVSWNDGQPGTPGFYSAHTYSTGNSPQHVAIGDLDGDGKPDLTVSNSSDGSVSVYRNTCIGGINALSFDAQAVYSTGGAGSANQLAVVDVDGDGRPDIVAANGVSPGTVTILRNLMPFGGFPLITTATPMTASAGTTVGIKGTNFTGALGVAFGGVPATSYTVNNPDSITAVVGNAASGQVVVIAPGGADSIYGFVFVSEPAPIVRSFSPASAGPYIQMTIHGTHLTNAVSATAGGVALTSLTLVNDSTLTGYPGGGASGYVAVFTTAGADSVAGFVYTPATPEIYSFSPTVGHPGDSITIQGFAFTGTTSIYLGGVPVASYEVLNDTTMIAVVGYGASGSVTVMHYGVSASKTGFIFVEPAPTVGTFSPTSGKRGDSVRISGHYFTGATAVNFGGTPAASFVVMTDSTVLTVVGTGSTGLVSVTTPQGYGPSLGTFTFLPDTTAPTPPDTTSPPPVTPPDSTAPTPPVTPPDTTAPAPPDTTATATPAAFSLQGLSAVSSAGHVILKWQTSNDQSIALYTIQEGTDSTQPGTIGSATPQHKDSARYVYLDPAPRTGVVWYRLLALDTTGKQVYSGSLSVTMAAATNPAYPNPAVGMLQVPVPNGMVNSQFELADMSGKVLLVVAVSPGTTQVQINVGAINTGTYQLTWSDGKTRKTQTVLIVR